MTTLTAEQQAGIEKIKAWYSEVTDREFDGFDGPVSPFRLFGCAGTGKTTMAKAIPEALGLNNVRYATFTGKAAHVLRRKGAQPVGTIHSGIYYPTVDQEAKDKLRAARDELAGLEALNAEIQAEKATDPVMAGALLVTAGWADMLEFSGALDEIRERVSALEAATRRLAWEWNPDSEWAFADLIILDEVSMVGAKLAADIERYGVPVLVLGDPAQLPPVEGGGYYIDAQPDHLLTEIHRQALESPVLELATRVRLSTDSRLGMTADDMRPATLGEALEADQVLCWSNPRRWKLIVAMRRMLGRPEGTVVPGDRVMCLANNKDLGVFNGQQFDVLETFPGALGPTLVLRDDEGHERHIAVFADGFAGQEIQEQAKKSGAGWKGHRMLATFANAITVHKAQGSEWGHVYVVNETPAMMSMAARRTGQADAIEQARKWLYTAVSRASDRVTVTRGTR